jgi:short-subunit dehydrogenase
MKRTNQKCALITGATSGIGYELAKLFAKDSFNLILVARKEEDLRKTASELTQGNKMEITTIAKDLFDVNASQEIYNEVKAKGLHVSVLVNDAGQGEYGFFTEIDTKRDIDIINLNVIAPVLLTKLFLKDMIEAKDGKILNLASIVSKNPTPLLSVYSATKAFIYSFSMSLRNELKDSGVSVTALLPGSTDTDFFKKAGLTQRKSMTIPWAIPL